MKQDKRAIVITGASSGIGLGTARVLVSAGFRVFGSVRRDEDGERVRRELGEAFTPLRFDVTDEGALREAAGRVASEIGDGRLAGLVNNAGIVVPGPLLTQSRRDFEAQVAVNLTGVFLTTQAFLPLLGTDPGRVGSPGRIVNVSSVGGKVAAPFIGAYAASKHAVEGLSESLRRELMLFGIDVVIVGPGSTATPIWDKGERAGGSASGPYAESVEAFTRYSRDLAAGGFPPERVGEVIRRALTTRRPSVRYAVVPGSFLNWTLPRFLPRRLVDWLLARELKLLPGSSA